VERAGNEFLNYREQADGISTMVGTAYTDVLYSSNGGAQQLRGAYVTTNTFPFLGVKPLLGRWTTDDDGEPGASPVFVLATIPWST
jgi:putative ABC transport system permease protein